MDSQEIICDPEQESVAGVRLVELNLPEDEGEGLGFRLTRTLWDPYPWIHEVTAESRADAAGLKAGDCLLQADGKDLLGLSIGKIARLIRGDGEGRGVSLLVWSCGVDPRDDPELLWSCGGGSRGERSRRALAGVVRALACCVCAATATKALNCARSHLYCEGCWSRLERCALCREPLPPKESPYSRNLVAEQVFEAIATEYEIKYAAKRSQSKSAHSSPNMSPTARRKGQLQLSILHRNRKPTVHNEKYASDPNIHRKVTNLEGISGNTGENSGTCHCQNQNGADCYCARDKQQRLNVPQISVEDTTSSCNSNCQRLHHKLLASCSCQQLQHKLVARLRHACSLADLQNAALRGCALSKSLNNISQNDKSLTNFHRHNYNLSSSNEQNVASRDGAFMLHTTKHRALCSDDGPHSNSMDNLKNTDTPVFVLAPPPVYILACEHSA